MVYLNVQGSAGISGNGPGKALLVIVMGCANGIAVITVRLF
jgi:hypothetical protein